MITLANGPTGKTLYVVYNDNTGLMFRTDNTFEALSGANWLQYAFALTESVATNQRYSRTTPAALLAGVAPYSVDVRLQAGTSPALSDISLTMFTLVDQLMALPLALPGALGGLDTPYLDAGTLQSATANGAVLRAGASATNKQYDNCTIQILAGTGAGQRAGIAYYNGGTKTITLRAAWKVQPDNTSTYVIRPDDVVILDASGDLAQAGTTTTIQLAATANATDNYYNLMAVKIIAGTGAGQGSRAIVGYVGSTKTATIDEPWAVAPDATSVYRVVYDHLAALNAAGQVSRNYAQLLPAPRDIESTTPDNTITAADAEWGAVNAAFGQKGEPSTISFVLKTPAGTTVRTWAVTPAVQTPTTIS